MIGLSWNCRGLGNSRAVLALQELVRSDKVDFIFLMETLVHAAKVEEIKRKLGFEGCFSVDREGRSGGLAFLWRKSQSVTVRSFSRHHIDVDLLEENGETWRCTGFYGEPDRGRRQISWDRLRDLNSRPSLPWCVIGDFNDLLSIDDKRGGAPHPPWLFRGFREVVTECKLTDLRLEDFKFTWERGRGTETWIQERLDRALVNEAWLNMFPVARLRNRATPTSDHTALTLFPRPAAVKIVNHRFRFENAWFSEQDLISLVKDTWLLTHMAPLDDRLRQCTDSMKVWSRAFTRRFKNQIIACKKSIERLRMSTTGVESHLLQVQKSKLNTLLLQEEVYWKQRAKVLWLHGGDSNTKVFHAAASSRKRNNKISKLQDNNGSWIDNQAGLGKLTKDYFQTLYEGDNSAGSSEIDYVDNKITDQDKRMLVKPFSKDEFRAAIFSMHPDKSPGPDGLNPGFFQKFWGLIGDEVYKACCSWLANNKFPIGLNDTIIVLIPKCGLPQTLKDLRPISLCNVLYKILAKVLANRLKRVLPQIISGTQSAFVPGRSITDSVLIAFELLHYMKRKTRGITGDVALKIDVKRAYDRITWSYLKDMLAKMDFPPQWVKWIMICVSSVSYSVSLNGELIGPIIPGRGLRQGDPLSPYLFIICAEGLSAMIRSAERKGDIHGCKICRGAPSISHLFFADDSFLFFQATTTESLKVQEILAKYELVSGQAVNVNKSGIFFSANVPPVMRDSISGVLKVSSPLDTGRYLGLPSLIGRNKRAVFSFLRERLWKRLQGWSSKSLSQAGRGVLIKTVAQAIPAYCMSIFLLPISLCDELEKMMNSFWWGMKPGGGRKLNWFRWSRLCDNKFSGGLGFRELRDFNLALLGKVGWNLLNNPNTLVAKLFKAKYFSKGDFLSAGLGANPSFTWKSIWSARDVVAKGCRWRIGDGTQINIWRDKWVRTSHNLQLSTPVIAGLENMKVCDLFMAGTKIWNYPLLTNLFLDEDVTAIINHPLGIQPRRDMLLWHYDKRGQYTVKSSYRMLREMESPSEGVAVIDWVKFWKLNVPPRVKIFIWRGLNRCLPSRESLMLRGLPIENTCVICGEYGEHALHTFLDCPFARQCWEVSNMLVEYHDASSFEGWFSSLLNHNSGSVSAQCCMILWGLWRHRNDKLWNSSSISPAQVVTTSMNFLNEFLEQQKCVDVGLNSGMIQHNIRWNKPPASKLKCNVDIAMWSEAQKISVGMVLRDASGVFLGCATTNILGLFTVKEAEAMGLREAILWLIDQNHMGVIVELDAKTVVDAFNESHEDYSEFGSIIKDCKSLGLLGQITDVIFVKRQANEVAHALAKAARFYASPSYWYMPPSFVEALLLADVISH